MKKAIFILAFGAMIFCSCGETNSLQSSEVDLDELAQQYDKVKYDLEFGKEGDDISPKVETREDAAVILDSASQYIAELMSRMSVAKEKVMRSAYSTTGSVVGVFKVGSCGNYKYLTIHMDCEDNRDASSVSGNVGDTSVDSNGNIDFQFCLTESNRYYPGGVLLVDHINYGFSGASMKILVRRHDTEDSNGSNSVYGNHGQYNSYGAISNGYTKVSPDNAILAWAFPGPGAYSTVPAIGPSGINYGLLLMEQASTGTIYCDDEDSKNGNWAQEYLNNSFQRDLRDYVNEFGVTLNDNTTYRVGVNTDRTKFYDRNVYYAARPR